jgi:tetratricopeptide (TPR) repeat protein/CRP-like cAMP-binding protein
MPGTASAKAAPRESGGWHPAAGGKRADSFEQSGRRPPGGFRGPTGEVPLVGRRAEMARLFGALERAAGGRGSLWSLTGPAGIGKSRLMEELSRVAARRGFETRWALSTWEGQSPLYPFVQLFPFGRDKGSPERKLSDRRTLSVGARRKPGRTRQGRPAPPIRTPDHLALDLLEALDNASLVTAQLLLIDDFHRSDPDSVRFLKLLARHVGGQRVVVLFSYREESSLSGDTLPPSLPELLEELHIGGLLHTLPLAALREPDMTRLARASIRAVRPHLLAPPLIIDALVRAASGNPFLLTELISAFLEGGPYRGKPDSAPAALARGGSLPAGAGLPHSIQEVLLRRLKGLSEECQRILGVAAIIGDRFRGEDVAAVLEGKPAGVNRALGHMSRLGWPIRRVGDFTDVYSFQHALLREVSFDLLPSPKVRDSTARLANHWKRAHPEDLETIARLSADSNHRGTGVPAVDRLIDEAIRDRSWASLNRYLRWKARMVGPSAPSQTRYQLYLFDILQRLRSYQPADSGRRYQEFLALRPPEPQRTIVESWDIALLSREDAPRAARLLEQLRRRAQFQPEGRSRLVQAQLDICQLTVGLRQGRFRPTLRTARRVCRALEVGGSTLDLLIAIEGVANCLVRLGRYEETRVWVRRGREVARRAQLLDTVWGVGLPDLEADIAYNTGNLPEAARLATVVARAHTELGAFRRAALAWSNVGAALEALREFPGAREAIATALRLARRWELITIEATCYSILGRLALSEGRLAEANSYFHRSLPLASGGTTSDEAALLTTRLGLAVVETRQRDLDAAAIHLRIAARLCRLPANRMMAPELAAARGEWLEERGELGAARRVLLRSLRSTSEASTGTGHILVLESLARIEFASGRLSLAHHWEKRARLVGARLGVDMSRSGVTTRLAPSTEPLGGERHLEPGASRTSPVGARASRGGSIPHQVLETLSSLGAVSGGPRDSDVVPREFTQAGLAHELGLPRDSFVRSLLRLVDRGAIVPVLRRVEGGSRIQKAYFLTRQGLELAAVPSS